VEKENEALEVTMKKKKHEITIRLSFRIKLKYLGKITYMGF